jgi:hypothetical protein
MVGRVGTHSDLEAAVSLGAASIGSTPRGAMQQGCSAGRGCTVRRPGWRIIGLVSDNWQPFPRRYTELHDISCNQPPSPAPSAHPTGRPTLGVHSARTDPHFPCAGTRRATGCTCADGLMLEASAWILMPSKLISPASASQRTEPQARPGRTALQLRENGLAKGRQGVVVGVPVPHNKAKRHCLVDRAFQLAHSKHAGGIAVE